MNLEGKWLVSVLIIIIVQLSPISGRIFSPKEIAQVFEHAAKHYPTNITEPTGTLTLKQVFEAKKGVTKYYLKGDDGKYDLTATPAFTRKKNDSSIKWLHIPKAKDRLYNWERQSIVVLRKIPKQKDLYSALIIHFRILTNKKLVYEWDDWRPRGYVKQELCTCSLVDKFYRYCTHWSYCQFQYSVYEQSTDDSEEDTRRKRGTHLDFEQQFPSNGKSIDFEAIDPSLILGESYPVRRAAKTTTTTPAPPSSVNNRIPPGSKPSLGPFFWDLVDDEDEQGILYLQIQADLKNHTDKQKFDKDAENDAVPFSGFGDCPYIVKNGEFDKAQKSHSPKELLEFLAKSVRIFCILQEEREAVMDLFQDSVLYWDTKRGDVFFNTTHPFTSAIDIDEYDLDNVEKAMHIAAFSRMYDILNKNIQKEKGPEKFRDAVSPIGRKISRNTRMIVLMAIKIYEMIQTNIRQHAVKLVKRMIANLKNSIMLNMQHVFALEGIDREKQGSKTKAACDKDKFCSETVKLLKRDQIQIVSLIYFFLFGTSAESIDDVFDDEEGETFDSWETLMKYSQFYEYHFKFLEKISAAYFQPMKGS